MPHFDIIRSSKPKESFRVASVCGTYDLQEKSVEERFIGDINLPDKWNIGLIVGRSGTGKSTIAKELFGDKLINGYKWEHECLLDDFPKDAAMNDIYKALNSVGFSSPPSWLKSFDVLSNGEKMRCELARAIVENHDMFVFDEFTSVVDRNIAKIGSFATQKAIRRANKKFIAVTCHYDVQEWLMPDWVFCTDDMSFQVLDLEAQKKNRPRLNINIFETKQKDKYWRIFGKYHYLNHNFNSAARCFVATCNDEIAAFCAVLPFPHPKKKHTWKGHRYVVLPDYQGIGLGGRMFNFVAQHFTEHGYTYIYTCSHPAMIAQNARDPKWRCTRIGRASKGSNTGKIHNRHIKGSTSSARITASFEYIGNGR